MDERLGDLSAFIRDAGNGVLHDLGCVTKVAEGFIAGPVARQIYRGSDQVHYDNTQLRI